MPIIHGTPETTSPTGGAPLQTNASFLVPSKLGGVGRPGHRDPQLCSARPAPGSPAAGFAHSFARAAGRRVPRARLLGVSFEALVVCSFEAFQRALDGQPAFWASFAGFCFLRIRLGSFEQSPLPADSEAGDFGVFDSFSLGSVTSLKVPGLMHSSWLP